MQEVKIIQRWDGQRPAINYLLRDFRRWLINEQMKQRLTDSRRARTQTTNTTTTIRWIEKLLQTPTEDHRKFTVWRILAPYLINIRKYSDEEVFNTTMDWLNRCNELRLQFNGVYLIKYNINSARRNGYLPISLEKLMTENTYLYNVLTKS